MEGIDRDGESLEGKGALHARAFERCYGSGTRPRIFAAPGRVNLMGAHLDYNGGPAMPLAIDRHTLVAVRPRADGRLRIGTCRGGGPEAFPVLDLPVVPSGRWVDYPLGVARAMLSRGSRVSGLDLLVGGDLPVGAGLSSSASLCLAVTCTLEALWEFELQPRERVEVALRAERDFVGVRCGILDPFAIAHARAGHVLWLETRDESFERLPLELSSACLAVVDTGVRRELATGAYNQRVEECARAFGALEPHLAHRDCLAQVSSEELEGHAELCDAQALRRARHVVAEVQRTRAARCALETGDLAELGVCMSGTHESLSELFEVSCAELDAVVDIALGVSGVRGGRLIGAGFGGCALILLERSAMAELQVELVKQYRARFGSTPGLWFVRSDDAPHEVDPLE